MHDCLKHIYNLFFLMAFKIVRKISEKIIESDLCVATYVYVIWEIFELLTAVKRDDQKQECEKI